MSTDPVSETSAPVEAAPTKSAAKGASKKKSKASEPTAAAIQPFAVIRTGGKQYRVVEGDRIVVERLAGDVGGVVSFDDVLAIGSATGDVKLLSGGTKTLGVKVTGKLVRYKRNPKVIIFKKRRRGGYTKKQGHRQDVTEVVIDAISA